MKKSILLITASLFLGACSGLKVVIDVDSSVDFTQFKTFEYYGWAKNSDKLLTQMDKDRIEKAFGNEFSRRGLQHVKNNGDIKVTLYIVTEKKSETTAHTNSYGAEIGRASSRERV